MIDWSRINVLVKNLSALGATAATLPARRAAEQEYRIACAHLEREGLSPRLRRKYTGGIR